ncbi:MAG: hypothetical protein ACOVT5_09975 [Armatimonadaceae bacterium]
MGLQNETITVRADGQLVSPGTAQICRAQNRTTIQSQTQVEILVKTQHQLVFRKSSKRSHDGLMIRVQRHEQPTCFVSNDARLAKKMEWIDPPGKAGTRANLLPDQFSRLVEFGPAMRVVIIFNQDVHKPQ